MGLLLPAQVLPRLLRVAIILPLSWYWIRQCRKPAGPLGRFVVGNMNQRHADLTAWGLQQVGEAPVETALDVGCGGGRTLQRLAAMTGGVVQGVDYSQASVQASSTFNQAAVDAGRIVIQKASVAALPFPDRMFDLVTAVETHYYWPNLAENLREVRRLLKPGGTFVILAEAYRGRSFDLAYHASMKLIGGAYLTPTQHRDLLIAAGFAKVELRLNEKKGWLCAMGKGV